MGHVSLCLLAFCIFLLGEVFIYLNLSSIFENCIYKIQFLYILNMSPLLVTCVAIIFPNSVAFLLSL